jgi:putative transposase
MLRIARGLADNQIYHIINRGNRRETVFHDNYDYEKFLKLLIESKEKYAIKIYAYSLSQSMHWISSSYVRYYNKRYNISGHLWQGRYKSFIVQEDSYLLVLLKYVEANPKRAKIVKDCVDYRYRKY